MEYIEIHDGSTRSVHVKDASVGEVLQLLTWLKQPSVDIVIRLNELRELLRDFREKFMSFEDSAIAKLTEQKTVADGVKTLLEQLTALVKAIPATDPAVAAKQAQILSLIDTNSQEIVDATIANTPGGPVVTPPPVDPAA